MPEPGKGVLHRPFVGYPIAVAVVAIAFLCRLAIERPFGPGLPTYVTFYPAVMVVAILLGLGPGILATLLAALAAWYWIVPPIGSFRIDRPIDSVGLAVFCLMGASISLLAEQNHRNRLKAAAYDREAALRESREALRKSEQRYRTLVDLAPDAVLVHQDEVIQYANAACLRLYGAATLDQVRGQTVLELIHPDDREAIRRRVQMTQSGGGNAPLRETRLLQLDGRELPIEATAALIEWEGKPAVQTIMRDITERKRAEEALRRRGEEVAQLLEVVPVAVWVTSDPQCLTIVGNRKANEMYEASAGENVSATSVPQARAFFAPDGRELNASELPMQVAAATNREVRDVELHVGLGSGRRMAMLGSAVPLRSETGEVRGCIGAFLDITERERAEEALRESEERLRMQMERMPIGCIVHDERNCFSQLNPAAERIFGYTAAELRGQHTNVLVAEAARPHVDSIMRRVAEGDMTAHSENENVTKDGRTIICQWTNTPLRDGAGNFIGSLSMVEDVTERKRIEAELAKAEEARKVAEGVHAERQRFFQVLETMPAMVCLLTPDHHVAFANRAFREKFGESQGRHCYEYCFGLTEPCDFCESYVALKTGQPHHWEVKGPDGSIIDAYDYPFADVDGSPLIMEMDIDITEVRKTQAALSEMNENLERRVVERTNRLLETSQRLKALMEAVPVGISFSNETTCQRITGNRAVLDQFEVKSSDNLSASAPDAEAPGRQVRFLRDGLPITDMELPLQRAVAENRGIPPMELEVQLPSGRRWFCEASGAPVRDVKGGVIAGIAVTVDITQRKQAEEALLRSEKLASVGRMAASVAHEINNPLSAVTNTLYLAKSSLYEPGLAQVYLDMADDELKRVSHITRQTLGFYRETSTPTTVSVNAIANSAVDLLVAKVKLKRAKVERQFDGDLGVTAVGGELRQVFSNLVANSLDAIAEGGAIKVRVSKSTCVNTGQARVRVTVADNGNGIAAATLPHIFEPLFTTKETTGSGLGLWVSKQIIDKHKGSIRVRSSTNGICRGTTFSVLIPVNAEPTGQAQAAAGV